MRWVRAAAIVLLIALLLTLVYFRENFIPGGATSALPDAHCGSCHRRPPPDAFPAASWPLVVETMAKLDDPRARALEPAAAAIADWYVAQAPASFEPRRGAAPGGPLVFTARPLNAPGLEPGTPDGGIPAVANLLFMPLAQAGHPDLLVCEMRSRTLFIHSPRAGSEKPALRVLATDLNFPVHVAPADVDGDGRVDLLVAGIGAMNVDNERRASVILLRQNANSGFDRQELGAWLARVCDVRAADFDGDGDADLVVCAFGWRGPGGILLLEQLGGGHAPPFKRHELDDRDGAIHAEPTDLDGDGRMDLVVLISQEHEQLVAYLNRGGLRFETRLLHQAAHPAWGYSGLQLIDMDGDGDLDALVSNGDMLDDHLLKPYHGVAWLENIGLQAPWREHPIAPLYGCERAVATDLDGDGDLDVVAVSFLPPPSRTAWRALDVESVIWIEKRPEGWRRHVIEQHRPFHPTLTVADCNGDGKIDIAVGNYVWKEADGSPQGMIDMVTLFQQRP